MYGYIGKNVFMTIKENDFRNIFSMQFKAKKNTTWHVKTSNVHRYSIHLSLE
jgi:hypothetical protein